MSNANYKQFAADLMNLKHGCAVCFAPLGTACTPECDDDSVPDEKVRMHPDYTDAICYSMMGLEAQIRESTQGAQVVSHGYPEFSATDYARRLLYNSIVVQFPLVSVGIDTPMDEVQKSCECGATKASKAPRGPGHASYCPWSKA